jgi:hypothetical protein
MARTYDRPTAEELLQLAGFIGSQAEIVCDRARNVIMAIDSIGPADGRVSSIRLDDAINAFDDLLDNYKELRSKLG